jgi:hypothetical protein
LNSQTTVEGGSNITLDGNNVRRIFVVSPRNPGDQTLVTFQNITLVRGFAADNFGGAILGVDGVEVTLNNVVINDSRALISGGAAAAKLFQLTMSANSVQNGLGGDVAVADVKADIELSTLIGGNASAGGSSVFVGNGGTAALRGNAIAVAAGSACVRTGNGALISAGNNVGPTSSCFGHASDLDVSTFAGLGLDEFADYAGNYLNYMPLPGSVLLDRFACAGSDARVKPRQVDIDNNGTALCETGALERQVRELPASVFRDGFE